MIGRHNNYLLPRQRVLGLSDLEMAAYVYKERQKPIYLPVADEDLVKVAMNRTTPGMTDAQGKLTHVRVPDKDLPDMTVKPQGVQKHLWIPYPWECRPCCSKMAAAPPNFPWHYKRHCKTVTHVAELFLVDEGELRRMVEKPRKRTGQCANAHCSRFRPAGDFLCARCRDISDSVAKVFG